MKQIPQKVRQFTLAWRRLQNIYNQYAKKLGLTTSFIDVIDVLYEKQPCTQKDVMDALFLPKQTVSFVVRRLEQKAYIQMQSDPADKRRNRIIFTAKGGRYAQAIIVPFVQKENEAMQQLPASKRKCFNELLTQYVDQLDQTLGEDKLEEIK